MDHRIQKRSKRSRWSRRRENLRFFMRSIPWRLLILLPVLILVAIPTFYFGTHSGQRVLPAVTNFFYNLTGPPPAATPTPLPPFPSTLPQVGSLLYTVQAGDSCDEILAVQMRMSDASTIFTDVKPNTIQALNATIGHDCHALQPGIVLALSPQYPLIAIGGQVLKVAATTPQQVLPTPLINVSHQQQLGADCSGSCLLTVRIAPGVQIHLTVQTTLPVRVGSWVWAQAQLARKSIKVFDTYPYANPLASLNGMSMRACDLQVDNTHDNHSHPLHRKARPRDHWKYPLHMAAGTRVLLWLTSNANGDLRFNHGNPIFRYDDTTHVYVRV